jgi:hypothetical protein
MECIYKCKIKARSHNHYCRGYEITIKYSKCVSVAIALQHAKRMRRIIVICMLSCCRLRLRCDGTRAETTFRLSAKRTSPFKSAWASVQSTTGSRGVRIRGSNAGHTTFGGSVKSTGYPLHSPVSPSLPLPCVTACHHISTGVYTYDKALQTVVKAHASSLRNSGVQLTKKKHLSNMRKANTEENIFPSKRNGVRIIHAY